MSKEKADFLQGTLEMLVLRTLALEPMHGWGLAQRIEMMSGEVFEIQQGTLYPALQRMKRKGWVQSEWRQTETKRRARSDSITRGGRKRLVEERVRGAHTSAAVNGILQWEGGGA